VEGEGELEVLEPVSLAFIRSNRAPYMPLTHTIDTYCKTPLKLICMFRPPLTGLEVHDEDGSYAASR